MNRLIPTLLALAAGAGLPARPALAQAPESHAATDFLKRHGTLVRQDAAECKVCHTQENCLVCHLGSPQVAADFFTAASGQAVGMEVQRRPPASHQGGFRDRHAGEAAATPQTCAGCHVRSDCLDCHRPDAASGSGYHPAGFLSRHPTSAYSRETSCSDCHNSQTFCATCHARAGLAVDATLGQGYHDAKRFFLVGHGQAARQSLENCVSCHAERDCLTCHAATGSQRFNPHGPDFNAARMKQRNPDMCAVCHGANIP
ncbi:MAG TPA: cytochrome c3 family protein [Gemmatimonadales bacterium]|nr:cytochrome c3 family protein [Gemmatimonadales bacterium]